MSLLNKILQWSDAKLVPWQRDAVRRLFEKEELDQKDYDDLYAMMKSAHNVEDKEDRKPIPLSKDSLPEGNSGATHIILKSLRDLEHVNKIANNQKLEISPTGMTIIYGGNGTGKSGYARVLKRACRARDSQEMVHTNAFDEKESKATPEAIFDIVEGGEEKSLKWNRDKISPSKLSTIAVFDSKCARAYLDAEQEAAFLPYGLDIMENLSQKVLPEITSRLAAELVTVYADKDQFNDLVNETEVGKIIAKLSYKTDVDKLSGLANIKKEELKRLEDLDKTLSETDPKAKAKVVTLSAQRIEQLVSRIDSSHAWVKEEAVKKIQAIDNEAETALKAESIAATEFRDGETLLDGTGDPVWKLLFESAKQYSVDVAYPGQEFPYVDEGSRCLLCQQELSDTERMRLQRFNKYITEDASKLAKEKSEAKEAAFKKINEAKLSFDIDEALKEELSEIDKAIIEKVQEYEKSIDQFRHWVVNALNGHDWGSKPKYADDPREDLKKIIEALRKQAEELDKAGDEEKKKTLKNEQSELRARANMAPRLKVAISVIEGLRLKNKLESCKKDLKTKPISDKAKELASEAVTSALKEALDDEFDKLGVSYIKTKLKERISKGKVLHKLILDLPVSISLNEVLSEGEQRAIALGSFLAEMKLSGHNSGIVFDDPVSSLDHYRRQYVARRLVEEAKERQVIIFTHDTVFLSEITFSLEQQQVDYQVHHLEWLGDSPGTVQKGLPWEHKSFKDRIDKHEKAQNSLQKSWTPHPNEDQCNLMRSEYSRLRATIERVIQDCVFNGTVQRYTDWIRVNHLEKVVGFKKSEYSEIARLHKQCCDACDAHDPSSGKNAAIPSASQLGKDIVDLVAVVEVIRARQKAGTGL